MILAGATPRPAGALPNGFTDTFVANVESPTALAFTPDGRLLITTQFGALRVIETDAAPDAALTSSAALHGGRAGLLGVAVDPAFATQRLRLPLLHVQTGRHASTGSPASRCAARRSPSRRARAGRRHPRDAATTTAATSSSATTATFTSASATAAATTRAAVAPAQNDASRDQHALVGKILRITRSGDIPPTIRSSGAGTARCNVTGGTDRRHEVPGDLRLGPAESVPLRVRPERRRHAFLHQRRRPGRVGGDRPRARPARTTAGTSARGPARTARDGLRAAAGGDDQSRSRLQPRRVELRGDHRRRLRAERLWPAAYDGAYLYGDYTCGKIFRLSPERRRLRAHRVRHRRRRRRQPDVRPVARRAGALLHELLERGEVRRIEATAVANRPPTARVTAVAASGALPLAVSFDGSTSSDPDAGDTLTYTWSFGDGSPAVTTTAATTSHTYTAAGSFNATLTVQDDHGGESTPASVRIDPGNRPPDVTIDSPTSSARFAVGETITLHATATDPEDGTLPPVEPQLARAPPPRHAHASIPRADTGQRPHYPAAGPGGSRLGHRRLSSRSSSPPPTRPA